MTRLLKFMPEVSEKNRAVLQALKEAVLRERSSKEFYQKRIQEATDPEVIAIYDQLYQEEVDHEVQLTAKFRGLCKKWGLDWRKELAEE